jgi:nucleoside-diphosphate kinase
MDRTFVICKPDSVERGLVGEIISRFERKGLRIVALESRVLDRPTLARHYAEHEGKPFYDDLVGFMSRGPAVVVVL